MPILTRAASRGGALILDHGPAIAALLIGLAALVLYIAAAFAFDGQKWGHDPETSAWFRSLRNGNGTSCCDYADGERIEDPDWREMEDGGAAVFAKGAWHVIPPGNVLKGTNRVGYAILWWPQHWPEPSCFLPGAKG